MSPTGGKRILRVDHYLNFYQLRSVVIYLPKHMARGWKVIFFFQLRILIIEVLTSIYSKSIITSFSIKGTARRFGSPTGSSHKNEETGHYRISQSSKDVSFCSKFQRPGLTGDCLFEREHEPGVDAWLQRTTHIHCGLCEGNNDNGI